MALIQRCPLVEDLRVKIDVCARATLLTSEKSEGLSSSLGIIVSTLLWRAKMTLLLGPWGGEWLAWWVPPQPWNGKEASHLPLLSTDKEHGSRTEAEGSQRRRHFQAEDVLTRVGGADFIAWGGRKREARKLQTFDALCVCVCFFFLVPLRICLLVSYFLLARELWFFVFFFFFFLLQVFIFWWLHFVLFFGFFFLCVCFTVMRFLNFFSLKSRASGFCW